jgi:hypothetical protein
MDEPEKTPEQKPEQPLMPDFELLQRHLQESRRRKPRQSIHESISNSRATLLTNLVIEIAAGLVLLAGIVYAMLFLYAHRVQLDPVRFKLYIEVMTFFTLAWFTYVGFKVRKKYRAFRNWGQQPDEPRQ